MAAWLDSTPILVVGIFLLGTLALAGVFGAWLQRWHAQWSADGQAGDEGGMEGYIVSAALALLGLLLGFTFALSVDRFETPRACAPGSQRDWHRLSSLAGSGGTSQITHVKKF